MVRARLPANPLFSVSGRKPRAGNFGFGGPPAGMVRAHLPASPLFSVSGREPRAGNFGFGGPPAGMVRAHLPASPLFSVSGREPRAGFFGIGGPPAGMVRAHLPAIPLFSVSGREPRAGNFEIGGPPAGLVRARLLANPLFSVSGREPRAGNFEIGGPAAGCFKARFAPRSPQTLAAPFRGANSSHKFRADARGRPPFPRRGLLPPSSQTLAASFRGANSSHKSRAVGRGRPPFPRRGLLPPPREPLQLRPGEQILHTNSAPTPETGRFFQGAVCSPLTANPCSSVPGSKFFTQIPRRRLPPAAFSEVRLAPPSPLTLAASFRGANSSHKFRADARGRPAFPRRGLLPPPRKPLRLRSGEQILHTNSALPHKKHLAGLSARCFPLSNSSLAGLHSLLQIPCGAV